jgi:hypothetical protein
VKRFLCCIGTLLVIIALFARQLRIDNDEGWGRGRIIILGIGIILVLAGMVIHFIRDKLAILSSNISVLINNSFNRPIRITIASLIAAAIVLTSYSWFIQLSQKNARQDYYYYIELAKSFKDGHLYLADKPSPALLSLSNPYDYFLRRQKNIVDFPWDVSLYKNRFYIYWGPVPALLISIFSREQLSRIGDFHLALVFACGLFMYSTLLIATFWQRSLQNTPAWILGALLLAVGISTPLTIMLKGAKIYETAIFGGQFFLMGGFYWAYSSITDNKPVTWKLALASIHYAFAAGTRIIILPAVLFCAVFTLIYIFRVFRIDIIKARLTLLMAMAAPLALAGLGLAWYNWARFDSIFEFGLKYQLANIDYTYFQDIFSFQSIPQNAYLYFIHPIKIVARFPYISRIEYLPSNERLAGLIYMSPYFLLLPLISLSRPINNLWSSKSLFMKTPNKNSSENWMFFALTGSGFLATTIILSYYFVAMRFTADFMPIVMVLTTIHIGREYDLFYQNPRLRQALILAATSLAFITISANILIAIPNSSSTIILYKISAISRFLGLK